MKDLFTPDQKLLALSWKQPYAELMLHGKVETRTWSTKYRGWVLICASKVSYTNDQIFNISGHTQGNRIPDILGFNRMVLRLGRAIAIGYLCDCRPMMPEDENDCFVQYYPDLFCHAYENVQAIKPFPWKGTQGWNEVSEEIKESILIIS